MKENKFILLLIEDNPLLTGMYKAAFEQRGIKVFFAHDGKTGLEFAKKEKPNLILLDLMMPGIDGFTVLKTLKENEATRKIKVIILTVVNRKTDREKALKMGAHDYIIKQELELHEIVERVIKNFLGL